LEVIASICILVEFSWERLKNKQKDQNGQQMPKNTEKF
jgi:hypothetical protein